MDQFMDQYMYDSTNIKLITHSELNTQSNEDITQKNAIPDLFNYQEPKRGSLIIPCGHCGAGTQNYYTNFEK